MKNYNVGDGKSYQTVQEAASELLPGGNSWISPDKVHASAIRDGEECCLFSYRTADGTQHNIFLPKLPDDEQYHYCNGEIWVVPKTGFHNVGAEDYIEVTGMICEVGRKWRQFWTVQRALDYMPVNLVETGENRIVCYEPRAWWWQRWLSTIAHWGVVVKRWVQRKRVISILPSVESEMVKEGASIEVVDVLPAEEDKND